MPHDILVYVLGVFAVVFLILSFSGRGGTELPQQRRVSEKK